MMTLSSLAMEIPGALVQGHGETVVSAITHDSRCVTPGALFAVVSGATEDGVRFINDAEERGAVALLCNQPLPSNLPQLVVDDVRVRLGQVAALVFNRPSDRLKLIGITGTNGKTTTAFLIESLLDALGTPTGVMGTIEYRFKKERWDATHTTPEAPVVQQIMDKMATSGAAALAMEVSSHGLALGRVNGSRFKVVAFTNLTQDHLDFHQTMADYGDAKRRLFDGRMGFADGAKAVVNLDDAFANEIIAHAAVPVTTISCNPQSEAQFHPVKPPTFGIDQLFARLATPDGEVSVVAPLIGSHNLNNLLVAMAICHALGHDVALIADAARSIRAVPGRLQLLPNRLGIGVLVDYAHTPDALERVLDAVRPLTPGRVFCVFGCGGDRDVKKRPLMGAAVARGADVSVVTSDNPRTEDPQDIIDMIIPGVEAQKIAAVTAAALRGGATGYVAVVDRREAIELAINCARPGDTVLIAGKGHEDYVIVGKQKRHFDDREEGARVLKQLEGAK